MMRTKTESALPLQGYSKLLQVSRLVGFINLLLDADLHNLPTFTIGQSRIPIASPSEEDDCVDAFICCQDACSSSKPTVRNRV